MIQKVFVGAVFLVCLIWQTHAQVNCTETGAGRFANPSDTTCKNYTLCVFVATTSTFVSYNYVCPTTSLFNPNTGLCTAAANYVCNVTTANTTITSTVCTAEGLVADTSVTNCSSYIECTLDDTNTTYVENTLTCPTGTYYNPTTTLCESTYNCTTSFSCTAAGRFADTTDTTCKRYFMCVLSATHEYTQYNYTCPSTSLFNPNSKLCTSTYTCTT